MGWGKKTLVSLIVYVGWHLGLQGNWIDLTWARTYHWPLPKGRPEETSPGPDQAGGPEPLTAWFQHQRGCWTRRRGRENPGNGRSYPLTHAPNIPPSPKRSLALRVLSWGGRKGLPTQQTPLRDSSARVLFLLRPVLTVPATSSPRDLPCILPLPWKRLLIKALGPLD